MLPLQHCQHKPFKYLINNSDEIISSSYQKVKLSGLTFTIIFDKVNIIVTDIKR